LVLLITSTEQNKTFPYHNKAILNYISILNKLHPDLKKANPIVSGSCALSLLYTPNTLYNDIDLYFCSQEDFDTAKSMLNQKSSTVFDTKNAVSYNDLKLQLIKNIYKTPAEVIYSHDFVNVSCAITVKEIFSTKETHYAWFSEELSLRTFQVSPEAPSLEKIIKLTVLLSRINKYIKRYNLTLSDSFVSFLKSKKEWLKKSNVSSLKYVSPSTEIFLDYYGRAIPKKIYSARSCLFNIEVLLMPYVTDNTFNCMQYMPF
jgi:hypothetical protein